MEFPAGILPEKQPGRNPDTVQPNDDLKFLLRLYDVIW